MHQIPAIFFGYGCMTMILGDMKKTCGLAVVVVIVVVVMVKKNASGQGDGHCRREVPALPDSPPGCPQGAQQHVIQGAVGKLRVEPETSGSRHKSKERHNCCWKPVVILQFGMSPCGGQRFSKHI